MNTSIKVAVIGGTGRAGAALVNELLQRGYAVRLLLRRPEAYTGGHPAVELVKGDATDAEAVHRLLSGCAAVISTLGQRKGEKPPFSQATGHVLQAMQNLGMARYILITGLSMDAPTDRKGFRTRLLSWLMRRLFAASIADKQKEYALLANSSAKWTLLRLPRIRVADTHTQVHADVYDCPGNEISTTGLAHFLVDELEQERFVRVAPFVADAR